MLPMLSIIRSLIGLIKVKIKFMPKPSSRLDEAWQDVVSRGHCWEVDPPNRWEMVGSSPQKQVGDEVLILPHPLELLTLSNWTDTTCVQARVLLGNMQDHVHELHN